MYDILGIIQILWCIIIPWAFSLPLQWVKAQDTGRKVEVHPLLLLSGCRTWLAGYHYAATSGEGHTISEINLAVFGQIFSAMPNLILPNIDFVCGVSYTRVWSNYVRCNVLIDAQLSIANLMLVGLACAHNSKKSAYVALFLDAQLKSTTSNFVL